MKSEVPTTTDREKLIKLIQGAVGGCATYWAGLIADHLISNGVTTVVRCAGCKWYDMDSERCQFWYGYRHPAHYCGEGERRTDEI